jgi:integrase
LSPQAIEIIESIRPLTGTGPYLFPHMTDPTRPMCNAVLLNALRRLGFTKEETTAHGFRSTFMTLAKESGWQHHVVHRALSHVQGNSVTQAYDRAQYLPERRDLLGWWANFIDGLVSGAKVTPIHAQAAS